MGESFKSKMPLYEANVLAEELKLELLRTGMEHVEVCGSVRRQKAEVGDLDIVVICRPDLMSALRAPIHQNKWRFADGGEKKCTLEYKGRQVNILRTDWDHLGAAKLYFTGNSTFNIVMRRKAKAKGLTLSEYGLKDGAGTLAARTEEDIFSKLGMEFVQPKDRSK